MQLVLPSFRDYTVLYLQRRRQVVTLRGLAEHTTYRANRLATVSSPIAMVTNCDQRKASRKEQPL